MASKGAYKRLTKEYQLLHKNPVEFIRCKPAEDSVLEWHYVLSGPPGSPFHGGEYWGKLSFPANYPYAPPAIRMYTPSGRFKPDFRLCLTMSDVCLLLANA